MNSGGILPVMGYKASRRGRRGWESACEAFLDQLAHGAHVRAALAMCENVDYNVGRILRRLEELQLDNDTIVIYFCDNGPNGWRWNGGMKGRKGSTDEGGVRSPLFVRLPATLLTRLDQRHDRRPSRCGRGRADSERHVHRHGRRG